MCAGVQNESRPIDICQEMSQCPPIRLDVIPAIMHQIVHGTESAVAVARKAALASKDGPIGMLSAIFAYFPYSLIPLRFLRVSRRRESTPLALP